MESKSLSLSEIRSTLIELLEGDLWKITGKAEADGKRILAAEIPRPTQYDVVKRVLAHLKAGIPLHAMPQGDPPGSRGVGYEMHNVDGRGLYVKLKVEGNLAWIISFHR